MRRALDIVDDGIGGLIGRAARRPLLAAALILAVALPACLSGFFALPPIDRTEVRYAQTSRQMLATGELASPRFQNEPQPTHPIGVYWLQAASAYVLGARDAIWAYRLPSLLGALAAVLITFFAARNTFGREAALIGALLLGVNLIVVLQAHLALTKGLHLAFVAAAQWSLARLYVGGREGGRSRHALVFWAAQGGGILTGVLALPLLSLATVAGLLAFDRDLSWLGRLRAHWGLPLALLLAAPWALALAVNPEPELVRQAWAEGLLRKLAGPQKMNWRGFPGMYVIGLWLGLLPGAVYAVLASKHAWALRGERPYRFLLAWIGAYLLAIELLSSKPPLYTLQMLMPAVAVAVGAALASPEASAGGLPRPHRAYWALCLLHALLPAAALMGLVAVTPPPVAWAPLLLALVAAAGVVAAQLGALRQRPFAWLGLALTASVLFYFAALQLMLPGYRGIWTSARLGEAARALAPCVPGRVMVAGYAEPSAVFEIGTSTFLTRGPRAGQSAADWLGRKKGRIAFVADDAEAAFREELRRMGLEPPLRVGCVRGLNIGRFQWVALSLYVVAEPSELAACRLPRHAQCETQD